MKVPKGNYFLVMNKVSHFIHLAFTDKHGRTHLICDKNKPYFPERYEVLSTYPNHSTSFRTCGNCSGLEFSWFKQMMNFLRRRKMAVIYKTAEGESKFQVYDEENLIHNLHGNDLNLIDLVSKGDAKIYLLQEMDVQIKIRREVHVEDVIIKEKS